MGQNFFENFFEKFFFAINQPKKGFKAKKILSKNFFIQKRKVIFRNQQNIAPISLVEKYAFSIVLVNRAKDATYPFTM